MGTVQLKRTCTAMFWCEPALFVCGPTGGILSGVVAIPVPIGRMAYIRFPMVRETQSPCIECAVQSDYSSSPEASLVLLQSGMDGNV